MKTPDLLQYIAKRQRPLSDHIRLLLEQATAFDGGWIERWPAASNADYAAIQLPYDRLVLEYDMGDPDKIIGRMIAICQRNFPRPGWTSVAPFLWVPQVSSSDQEWGVLCPFHFTGLPGGFIAGEAAVPDFKDPKQKALMEYNTHAIVRFCVMLKRPGVRLIQHPLSGNGPIHYWTLDA